MPVVGRRAAVVVRARRVGRHDRAPGQGPERRSCSSLRRRGAPPFDAHDLELMATFAARASVVLELARTQRRAFASRCRPTGTASRPRPARPRGQRIFATALSLDRLSRVLQPEQPEAAERLCRIVDELDGTMAEIRAAIFELHQDGPEPATVRSQLADVIRGSPGPRLPARRPLPRPGGRPAAGLVPDLVAVVQELVTNVVRHASAVSG